MVKKCDLRGGVFKEVADFQKSDISQYASLNLERSQDEGHVLVKEVCSFEKGRGVRLWGQVIRLL